MFSPSDPGHFGPCVTRVEPITVYGKYDCGRCYLSRRKSTAPGTFISHTMPSKQQEVEEEDEEKKHKTKSLFVPFDAATHVRRLLYYIYSGAYLRIRIGQKRCGSHGHLTPTAPTTTLPPALYVFCPRRFTRFTAEPVRNRPPTIPFILVTSSPLY